MLLEHIKKLTMRGYRISFDTDFKKDGIQVTLSKDNYMACVLVSSDVLNETNLKPDKIMVQILENMEEQF